MSLYRTNRKISTSLSISVLSAELTQSLSCNLTSLQGERSETGAQVFWAAIQDYEVNLHWMVFCVHISFHHDTTKISLECLPATPWRQSWIRVNPALPIDLLTGFGSASYHPPTFMPAFSPCCAVSNRLPSTFHCSHKSTERVSRSTNAKPSLSYHRVEWQGEAHDPISTIPAART